MINITDDDIDKAQRILLKEGETFDEERRTVIKCIESKDVQACPGSGKTTALLAKLLIISNKLPLEGNKGICVLTHTNVAIDEIRTRMELSAERLFGYPNHFGTIQSFVDKFLTTPAYIHLFHRRPTIINNDWYNLRLYNQFKFLKKEAKIWCYKRKGYPYSISFDIEGTTLKEGISGETLNLDLENKEEKNIYDSIYEMKKAVMVSGILSYDDAYTLAYKHINLYPKIGNLLNERFPLVFIDEMQDSDNHQVKLLNKIFDPQKIIIQRIGDYNQAIYNTARDYIAWDIRKPTLDISGSKRFSNHIAKIISPIALEPQLLVGNDRIQNISPKIIAFADDKIVQVIPKFGEIIMRCNLHREQKKVFKAIGWRGKPHEKYHTIGSYWPKYKNEVQKRKSEYSNLWNYLVPQSDTTISIEGASIYREPILNAFVKLLRLLGITDSRGYYFNLIRFLRYIADRDPIFYNKINLQITIWCKKIHSRIDIKEEVKTFIETDIKDLFNITSLQLAEKFLTDNTPEPQTETLYTESNQYVYNDDVKIVVSTIHGVKGETHTATFYLETFYFDYDILRIINYLKGNHTIPTKAHTIENLKMSYVAMSRPSHLLCIAVHKHHIIGHEEGLIRAGWELNYELA
jgi:DNA helicase II / ATP-dependent DNA helicase PcrA